MAKETRNKSSHIPVMASRPPQSSLSSTVSTPQLGIVHQGRYLAVSGSPSYPPLSNNTSTSGLPTFRSFRNLLPFGPGKNTLRGPSVTPARSSTSGERSSVPGERSVSAPHLPVPNRQGEDPPVLSIELSHHANEPLFEAHELHEKLGSEPHTPESMSSPPTASAGPLRVTEQQLLHASDLSTIMEADTTGISKHLPALDDSQETYGRPSPKTTSAQPLESDMQDDSVLDFSAADVGREVLAALSASDQKNDGWLNGVVVEDAETVEGNELGNSNTSFNLSALDKDLADLLKSKRPLQIQPVALNENNALPPTLLTPPLTDVQRGSRTPSPHMTTRELGSPAQSPATVPNSPASSPHHRGATSTLSRTSSLARPVNLRPPPATLARLARSASEKPSYFSQRSPLPSPTKTDLPGRQSLQLPTTRTSPLLQESALPARPTSSDGPDAARRKSALSRLATPSRRLAAVNDAQALSRQLPSPTSTTGWDPKGSVSSRSTSVYGTAPSRRTDGHRPSLDRGEKRPWTRGRDRSASLTESVPYHAPGARTQEWMGPRTAKVFAAAGLLDDERERGQPGSRPGTRFGFNPSRSDRDYRSQYAPSRAGFSEVGSSVSWGRRSGSISHTGTGSEVYSSLGTPDSVMTPRTTYSAASTAPTSISTTSSVQRHLESEIQRLEEKHSIETSALLNALADSQRTTRILREENAQLRDRVQLLEDELAGTQEALHKLQFTPPFATSTLPRSNAYNRMGGRQPAEPLRRPIPHSRLQTHIQTNTNHDLDNYEDEDHKQTNMDARHDPMPMNMPTTMPSSSTLSPYSSHAHEPQPRRYSSSSSVFASLPSNMPMLLQEDGGSFAASPPSPRTLSHKQSSNIGHHRAMSSAGNISPTTANFSILTGSPRSLDLRSEHERLLGDMPSLDLHAGDYESQVFHDM